MSRARELRRKARRAARRAWKGDERLFRESSFSLYSESPEDLLEFFDGFFPECSPLLLPYKDGYRGVVCVHCGSCLVRKPDGELIQSRLDLDEFFR